MFSPENKIPLFKVFMSDTAAPEVTKVLNSGYIGQGPKVDAFEDDLKKYFDHDYVQTVNAGTSALHLALHLLKKRATHQQHFDGVAFWDQQWPGLEPGDEVLATAMTCTASNWPVLANGLKLKWVDIDPKTLNMDLDDLARKITPKTKVIMLVHWGGYPTDLDRVKQIQDKAYRMSGFRPAIIEDGAHSFGSEYKGKRIGNHVNLTMFSLQAIKLIPSIYGGVLISSHKELHQRGKLIRWYGICRDGDRKYFRCESYIEVWGYKFHMNDVCATVVIENLKYADRLITAHK